MPRDLSVLYIAAVDSLIDKLTEGIHDVVSSIGHSSKQEIIIKLGKLNWVKETLIDMLPEDFDKKDFEPINRHLHFVDYYYSKDRDFSMLKSNADDLLKQDLPALKRSLKLFYDQEPPKHQKTMQMSTKNFVSQLVDDVRDDLRCLVRECPDSERKIQDHLEDLLALKKYRFEREQVSIPYSTKSYIPDFTSEELSMAIEVKLCNSSADERKIIDEMNADILAYKLRYQYTLFVVYDISVIRKMREYVLDIEKNNPGVTVVVIKH